jgi:hypothetical protein
MHTCEPPGEALDKWLRRYPSVNGTFGHLLLEQKSPISPELLRPYYASAHRDAREFFDRQIGFSLHPDATDEAPHAIYPGCLPVDALRGLFGEVAAGLVTQHFQDDYVGGHAWSVPIFLFREHHDVEAYLFNLARNATHSRKVFGRQGSDFLGLSFNDGGEVVRFIAGEAKWRLTLTQSVVDSLMFGKLVKGDAGVSVHSGDGIWNQLSRDIGIPHGARQLQRLLQERAPDEFQAAILSLDRALLLRGGQTIPRTNLVLIIGNGGKTREPGEYFIDYKAPPPEYTASNDLQVVELVLIDGEKLVDSIYADLWDEEL